MRMDKLNFVEFEYDMERMGQTKSGLEENETTDPFEQNLRLCIMPKLWPRL